MPRFGELLPSDVWAATARTLTDFSAEELFDLPVTDDLYGFIDISASALVDTFGSSAQISADVGVGKRLIYVTISTISGTVANACLVEFGDAADGAGNIVALAHVARLTAGVDVVVPVWISLADNSALHVRVKNDVANATRYALAVQIA